MKSAKDLGLPEIFESLPSFEFTSRPAATREESADDSTAYNIKTHEDLAAEVRRRLATPKPK